MTSNPNPDPTGTHAKLSENLRAALAWRRMLGIHQNEFGWKGVTDNLQPDGQKMIHLTYYRAYSNGDGTLRSTADGRITINFTSGRVTISNNEMTADVPLWRINYDSHSIRSLLTGLGIRPTKKV